MAASEPTTASNAAEQRSTARVGTALLLAILGVAAALRLWGIGHDLPFVYYGDEVHKMNLAMGFGTGDLNPHWFHKPALYMYVLFLQFGVYFVGGHLLGAFPNADAFAVHYLQDKTAFALCGRLTSAACGVACVWVLYRLARRHYGRATALVAAGLLAVAYPHVRSSHFAKADQMAALFTLLGALYVFRVAEAGRWRDYLLAGLFLGLGTGTKYTPILLAVALYVAHVAYWRRSEAPWWSKLAGARLWAAGGVLLLAFFVASPYNFLDSFWLRENVLPLLGLGKASNVYLARGPLGHEALPARLSRWTGVVFSRDALGPVLATAGCLGLLVAAVRRRRQDVVLAACAATLWGLAGMLWHVYEPWLLNGLYPFLCLGAALLAVEAVEWASRRIAWLRGRQGLAVALLAIALAAPSAIKSARLGTLLSQPDTRTLAHRWVEANVPAGSRLLVDEYGPRLSATPESLQGLLDKAKELEKTSPFTYHLSRYYKCRILAARPPSYDITELSHLWWRDDPGGDRLIEIDNPEDADFGNPAKPRGALSLDEYVSRGVQYAVVCSTNYNRYLWRRGDSHYGKVAQFYKDLMGDGETPPRGKLLHEETHRPGHSRGPTVRVYRLPAPAARANGGGR
ncbi:MAG: phospholipid carrier-dependent glycosyltransferase [Planctomycetes bacterium]|nr:phospholipid carrier-dependent glycosyltransferase [Planctomycetota bacterium]